MLTSPPAASRPWVTVLAVLFCVGTAARADDHDRGPYVGFHAGYLDASSLDSGVTALNHPTKCDVLLYPDPSLAPTGDPECQADTPTPFSETRQDPGGAFTGFLTGGYDFGSVRLEAEYTVRRHVGEGVPVLPAPGNAALTGKGGEWSPLDPPTETIRSITSRELFLNGHWDFENNSSWTPFVGVGVGVSRTRVLYSIRFVRKTLAQGYQDVEPPLELVNRPAEAAGTLSLFDCELGDTLMGYQLLAGLERSLGDRTSFGGKARWTRFDDLNDVGEWQLIRSHEPVQADGVTPFVSAHEFDPIGYLGVTAGLRYSF